MANDQLIDDLTRVPNIIGSLGLAIAEAQKQFNVAYVESLDSLVVIASKLMGQQANAGGLTADAARDLLLSLAPPRYQFTETQLSVKLDLSQSIDFSGDVSLGFGFSGVVVNAAFALGYASDFAGAAECSTTIHAVLPGDNQTLFNSLLERVATIDATALTMPANRPVDVAILNAVQALVQKFPVSPAVAPPKTPSTP
jgi:hypothetical protein